MISNARGKHSSPGVYIEEIDKSYATRSLGATTLGVAGETLKGPAFDIVSISDWTEFQEYFGGTSTEKFKGNKYPKYELPYIAKSYLQESKQIEVCRILGLSGYNAGPAWTIYGYDSENNDEKYIIAILRSKAQYSSLGENYDPCNNTGNTYDVAQFTVTGITMEPYTSIESVLSSCETVISGISSDLTVGKGNYGKFKLVVNDNINIPLSLNPSDKNYIINVLGMSAQDGDYPLFVEELYDVAHIKVCDSEKPLYNSIGVEEIKVDIDWNGNSKTRAAAAPPNGDPDSPSINTGNTISLPSPVISDYKEPYRCAMTPWFVSELKGNGTNVEVKKLFRFYTISDGNAANSQIKISVANILPDEGLFDIIIRDYNDNDASPIILERFNKCNMVPGTSNYIGLKIGTFNGEYENKSKYVTVEVIENDVTETCVPCGFLGYPMRKMEGYKSLELEYNTNVYEFIKPNRQYFGMSDLTGVDLDVLAYKGKKSYKDKQHPNDGYSRGFHLDSYINAVLESGNTVQCTVDGISGYTFSTPDTNVGKDLGAEEIPHISSEDIMSMNIYADKRYRKFTCYPYGGFDGWDIYREKRTNTSEFRANKYKGIVGDEINNPFTTTFDASAYGISGKFNTSDYYAYLAGYKQFDNPNKIKINLLATPGIDYVNNLDLFNEVLDIVEESRQGDCLYIVTTPDTDENGNKIDPEDAVANLEAQEISTSYAATYYPWVKYYDTANKKYINLPVTKDVMRNFAYTDNVSQPWFASAGMSRGSVDCVKAHHFTKLDEEDALYEGMINPVKSFGSDGVKIWGNKTMYQEDTPLNRINVRRLMIRIKDLVMKASRELIFEQNDATVAAQFLSIVDPILANAKQNRGVSDYKIKTDTSAEARDRKELPAKIWVKPINCLEYIPISFVITPEGASFED